MKACKHKEIHWEWRRGEVYSKVRCTRCSKEVLGRRPPGFDNIANSEDLKGMKQNDWLKAKV